MDAPTCAMLGAMGPLLRKLASVMASGGHTLPDEVKNELDLLLQGIHKIHTPLVHLSEAEELPLTAKLWMKGLRELSYDMEDYFDQVVHSGSGNGAMDTKPRLRAPRASGSGLVKISRLYKTKLKRRSLEGTKIMEFIARVQDAHERYERYGLDSLTFKRRFVSYGPRLPVHHEEELPDYCQQPVGDLMEMLEASGQGQLKVVSIVGPGGVGKTALAARLYKNLRGRFECRAFVRATPYPDMRRLLTSIFIQIQRQQPHNNWDTNELIHNIAQHLSRKRYFIVVDDIWSLSLWDILSRAFPNDCSSSRIITTTQADDVALACCSYISEHIFEMRPLDEKHSRKLFFNRVFGCEDNCPIEFKEVSFEIIRHCDGLPLSIVSIASVIQCETVMLIERWKHIQSLWSTCWMNSSYSPEQQRTFPFESSLEASTDLASEGWKKDDHWSIGTRQTSELLYTSIMVDDTSEELKNLLCFVYNNLPPHMKTLLLYLNMYPADYTIKKSDLVKQWIAEGFLNLVEGQDREKALEGYFDELTSRGLIQPVEISCNGQLLSCTVNHMVLDLIGHMAQETNFITTVDYLQTSIRNNYEVRRLSVLFGGSRVASLPAGIMLSQVRTLTFFGFIKCVPSIVKYKLLRVLIFHIWADEENTTFDLDRICELFLLRYLKIKCNVTVKLPVEMQSLKFLETLEVDAKIDAVPSDIVDLPRLLHLHLPRGTALPDGIGHKISLHTLGDFYLSSKLENNVLQLGMLTNLHDLQLTCPSVPYGRLLCNMDFVGSILSKLSNIMSLTLVPGSSHRSNLEIASSRESNNGLRSVPFPRTLIQRLDLLPQMCTFSTLPIWIRSLDRLYVLKIAVRELSSSDINVLKELPALTALSLHVQTTPLTPIVIGQEGFPVLRFLTFKCSSICLAFHKGSMANVERIKLRFCIDKDGLSSCVHAGLENLTRLKEISAKVWLAAGDEVFDRIIVEKAESDFMRTIKGIVETPITNVRCVPAPVASTFSESSMPSGTAGFNKIWNRTGIITENAMVTSSTGAMNSVAMKLATLTAEPYSNLTGRQREAMSLKHDLDALNTILQQLGDMAELQDLRNEVREITYDIEDWTDDDGTQQASTGDNEERPNLQKFIDPLQGLIKKMKNAAIGSTVHKTEVSTLGSTYYVASGSRLSRFSSKGVGLVGMDGTPRGQLINRLKSDDEDHQMLCIFGSPGVGKTRLAKEVYRMVNWKFDRVNFLTVMSKEVNIKVLLGGILSPLVGGTSQKLPQARPFQNKLPQARRRLKYQRHLIVIDGVWSADQVLDDIIPTFAYIGSGSMIIITTCDSDVADSCGKNFPSFICRLEPLNFEDSLSLFRTIIFGSGRRCPIKLEKVAEKIVKSCCGIPLALSVIASVLASKPAEMVEWDMVEERMALVLAGTSPLSVEWMRQILYISYCDLPRDMRTCLLYLSAFRENHVIQKHRLIRRWKAEGFLPKINEENWWETGERYFLELIARNLIEPVIWEDLMIEIFPSQNVTPEHGEKGELNEMLYDEMPLGCKVSSFVQDFITLRSNEENLVTPEATFAHHEVVRRQSISRPSNNNQASKVRSLFTYTTGNDYSQIAFHDLSTFRLLRVLDLEGNQHVNDSRLENAADLSLLRYLGLAGTPITLVFDWILALEHLETIDLTRSRLGNLELPAFRSRKLASLLADNVEIPSRRTGETQELEELSVVNVKHNTHILAELVNKSKRMRILSLRFSHFYGHRGYNQLQLKHLLGEVAISSLQSLCLDNYPVDYLGMLLDCWSSHTRPRHMRRFELRLDGRLWKFPQTMAALIDLTHLRANVEGADADDIHILGNLPNLVSVKLSFYNNARRRCIISRGSFRCLKVFCCQFLEGGMWLGFDAEAMPQLRWLELVFNAETTKNQYGNFDFGIQNLSSLIQFRGTIKRYHGKLGDAEAATNALRHQVFRAPNNNNQAMKVRFGLEYDIMQDEG
ncbi:hypothetical protein BS78_05G281800 [Paspalum vaginatum]|nr:hypothetical protein BS78_05G281800 [Paspalum vaginatum]